MADVRHVEISIPTGRREAVLAALDEEEIDYVVTDETSGRKYTAVARFPLPSPAVEPVLDRLEAVGIDEDAHVVVIDAETVISRRFARLQERYAEGDVSEDRISRQELQTEAKELTPTFPIYAIMTLISAIVATAGLLLDSPAVVVGSMVIAPLIGPALSASVGIVIGDDELRSTGITYQAIGVGIAIVGATVFAVVARFFGIVPVGLDVIAAAELQERLAPNLLSLAVALGAGVAGIMSISTGLSVAIVGVMIAAALIPPAAAVGVAVAWGMYDAAIGALVLVLVNLLSVNFAGLATLWLTGYEPSSLFDLADARRQTIKYAAIVGVVVLVLTVPLAGVTLTEHRASQLNAAANDEVAATLDDSQYEELHSISVTVELDDDYPIQSIDRVVVVVAGPEHQSLTPLVDELYERIAPHAAEPITVEVQLIISEERGDEIERSVESAEHSVEERPLHPHATAYSAADVGT